MRSAKTNCFVDMSLLVYTREPDGPKKRALIPNLPERVTAGRALVLSRPE
jgi:hypothetical protein